MADREEIALILHESCNPEIQVLADEQRLKQVFLSLLSNAVKYNRPHGTVTIACSLHGRMRRVSITDTGLGIPPERVPQLFVPFERLGAQSTDIEGTGLGLALSRRIAQALGGDLGVHSVVGEGSTFWIELPGADAPSSTATQPDPTSAGVAQDQPIEHLKLLYVDDQDLNLRLVERIISGREGYELITATQGRLAVDLALEHRPDIILLDLNLPDMNGEEILRRLKADPNIRSTPVIMISADAVGERIEELIALGASGYLTKPYKLTEFFAVIDSTLLARH
jgi:CheY-like chemotaxis protein